MNPPKCKGPSQILPIFGLEFNAILRKVSLPADKRSKYLRELRTTLRSLFVISNRLEKLIGYLSYASYAEPFGRPFLSALTSNLDYSSLRAVMVDHFSILAMKIWEVILLRNRGVSYDFILGKLPSARDEIFVDASSS